MTQQKIYTITIWKKEGDDKVIILKKATKYLKDWEIKKGFVVIQSLISGLTGIINKIGLKEIGTLK